MTLVRRGGVDNHELKKYFFFLQVQGLPQENWAIFTPTESHLSVDFKAIYLTVVSRGGVVGRGLRSR
jgi:hypothetical protein